MNLNMNPSGPKKRNGEPPPAGTSAETVFRASCDLSTGTRKRVSLVNEHWARIYRMATLYSGDGDEMAQKITALTFTRIPRQASCLEGRELVDSSFVSLLRDSMPARCAPLGTLTLRPLFVANGPLDKRVRRTLREIKELLPQLPPTERLIFLFYHSDRRSAAYVARILGMSEQDVVKGAFYSLVRLRELLNT